MMTKRVTVTVPDDIHNKMEKWKRKFNYSGIFQEAVSREIAKKELFVSKVQQEKSLKEIWNEADFDKPNADFEVGREMGFVFAKISPYYEIKSLEEYVTDWDKKDENKIEKLRSSIDINSVLYSSGSGKSHKMVLEAAKNFSRHRFEWGFMTGLMEFLKEEVGGIESSFLVTERGKKIRKAKRKAKK